jgi:methanogenic corrinoid protein MtbC1
MASKEELFELLKDGVINYKEEQVKEASQQAVDDGFPALEMIMDGLAAGMEVVGDLYERHEYFVPEPCPQVGRGRGGAGGDRQHSGRCARHR